MAMAAAVSLPLGMVATVGVSWWFQLWVRQDWRVQIDFANTTPIPWPRSVPPSWSTAAESTGHTAGPGWAFDTFGGSKPSGFLHEVRTGWPALALKMHWVFPVSPVEFGDLTPDLRIPKEGHDGLAVPAWMSSPTSGNVAPIRPIPLGFALDTLLYAAVVWVVLLGFPAVRNFRRARRGWCVKCGYDLAGLRGMGRVATCPECGAVPHPSAPT
jgi:hypothetical protein